MEQNRPGVQRSWVVAAPPNLRPTPKESHANIEQMRVVGYISDPEAMVKAYWSNFWQDGAAGIELLGRSRLPPALSVMDLPGGQTHWLNVHRIRTIDCHPVQSANEMPPESISNTENWHNLKCDLDNPNQIEDDWKADHGGDVQKDHGIKHPDSTELRNVSAVPNFSWWIQPTHTSNKQGEKVFMTANAISKIHFRPGGMTPSEWTRSVRAVRDTPVADYSTPGINATRRVAYCPLIAVSPFLLAIAVS